MRGSEYETITTTTFPVTWNHGGIWQGASQYWVYMKVFAGGNLLSRYNEAIAWVRSIDAINAVAIGVINLQELMMNLRIFGVDSFGEQMMVTPVSTKTLYIFRGVCKGCGACVQACPKEALTLQNSKAVVDPARCVMCGYCSPFCPKLAIRVL